MMSGQELLETLHQIGYPQAQNLSAKSFDWMFGEEGALPFLSWFCSSVGHQNVLGLKEQQIFQELESEDAVVEGPLLEEALRCLSSQQQELSLEALQSDVQRMKEDLERHRQRKEKLVKARNSLSLHHTQLTHRLSKLGEVEMNKKQGYRRSVETCHRINAETNASLHRVADSVQRLCSLYGDQGVSRAEEGEGPAVFLSQLDLQTFHRTEEAFSRALTAFTKKLFFEGIADMAGGEASRYQLLEVSDPTTLLVKGPSHETFVQDCQELTRLQTLFPRSEGERINAMVQARCAQRVLEAAEDVLRNIQNGHFPASIQDISGQTKEVKARLSGVSEELRRLTEGEVGTLVREVGALQATRVLTGDYRLKLARQDYFISNQNQVLDYLVQQRARNEFLTMAYEIEARGHRDVHHLLTAVQQSLAQHSQTQHVRMQAMGNPLVTKARYDHSTIDSKDSAGTRLHHMLVPEEERGGERALFLSYSRLVQGAEQLKHGQSAARALAQSMTTKYRDKVQQLEGEVGRCEGALWGDNPTAGGVGQGGTLGEATAQLEGLLQRLEAAVCDVVNNVTDRKKALKKDPFQSKERQLFTYFYVNPDRLRQTMNNLEERLHAHQVK